MPASNPEDEGTARRVGRRVGWRGGPVPLITLAVIVLGLLALVAGLGVGPLDTAAGSASGHCWRACADLVDQTSGSRVRVRAHTIGLAQGQGVAPGRPEDLLAALGRLRDWLMWGLAALATVIFTVGAVRYLLANGQIEEIEAAKRAFKSAAFGYGLAVLAPAVVAILRSIVGQ